MEATTFIILCFVVLNFSLYTSYILCNKYASKIDNLIDMIKNIFIK